MAGGLTITLEADVRGNRGPVAEVEFSGDGTVRVSLSPVPMPPRVSASLLLALDMLADAVRGGAVGSRDFEEYLREARGREDGDGR